MNAVKLVTAAAVVALCAAMAPVHAELPTMLCDGSKCVPQADTTPVPKIDWCGNPGQETCIPVVAGKCPDDMDPNWQDMCVKNVDGPADAAAVDAAAAAPVAQQPLAASYRSCIPSKLPPAWRGNSLVYNPEPIRDCHVPREQTAAAMNWLMEWYNAPRNSAGGAWVNAHCIAEPLGNVGYNPRNKLVCTENGVTLEYR
jgi:hypothetical protein